MKEDLGSSLPYLHPQQGDGESPLENHFQGPKGSWEQPAWTDLCISESMRTPVAAEQPGPSVLKSPFPTSSRLPFHRMETNSPSQRCRSESHFGPYIALEDAS